jgi:hypothetical protein
MVQDPVTQPTRHKHRSKPKESRIARLWREMPELFWLALAIAGFVLFTAYSQIRYAMDRAASQAANAVGPRAHSLTDKIAAFFNDLSPAEIIGFILLLIALIAIAYRLRWRVTHSKSLTQLSCPRCGGDIHRVHRHTADRIINLFVPVRRYRCWNEACTWSGLRVTASSTGRSSRKRR